MKNPFEISGTTVLVDGRPLKMAVDGFQVLHSVDHSYSVWLKNNEGYYYLESYLSPSTLKKLKCGTLTVLNHEYAKDETTVFLGAKPIPGSDPQTFRIVEEEIPNVYYFSYDQNQLYALSTSREGLQIWTDIDTATLEFFPEKSFFADRNHLYYFNWHFIEYANHFRYNDFADLLRQKHPTADAWWNWSADYYASLRNLGDSYYRDGQRVFYRFADRNGDYPFFYGYSNDTPYYSLLAGADGKTFRPLNDYYGQDKDRIYHLARPIEADLDSFRIIDGNFALDRRGIWFNGYFCADADGGSFALAPGAKSTDSHCFAQDRQALFSTVYGARIGKYQGYSRLLKPLKNSDPASFQIINDVWAKDKNQVYCYGKIWSGIDANTFEFLFTDSEFSYRSYAKCKNGLYDANGRRTVKGIDVPSFVMLNEYWGKDKNSVFCFKSDRICKSIDADSFEVLDANGRGRDKNFEYQVVCGTVTKKKRRS